MPSMDAYYAVIYKHPCSHCRGSGRVEQDYWTRLRTVYGSQVASLLSDNSRLLAAFHSLGWYPASLPPAQVLCEHCAGSGILRTEVALDQALRELGILPAHVNVTALPWYDTKTDSSPAFPPGPLPCCDYDV
jgi:DnaJ-class molecular chaperone